jgi:outer membrane receptor protein involved in Fe transport
VGHRWQGLHGTLQTSIAWYHLERNNVVISRGAGRFDQAGQQSANGVDLDVKGSLGHGVNLIANYGYVVPRFDNFVESGVNLSGFRPRFVPLHTANLWLTKQWKSGITTSIGSQTVGSVYADNADTIRLGGWTTFRGAVGYTRPRWEFNLNAENLFNRQRYFTGADYSDQVYPGSPINVFATVRLRFK